MNVRGAALRRSRTNRIVAGVCGGLGDFFGVDPFWFRLGFLIASARRCAWYRGLFDHVVDRANRIEVGNLEK